MDIKTLRAAAHDFVHQAIVKAGGENFWQSPLVATAPVDARFKALPEIAAPDHLHPKDLLKTARTVVVFFIPFVQSLVKANRGGERPIKDWGVAYVKTNALIEALSAELEALLKAQGHACALTPATHNFDEVKLTARWSHKHLGHLANLGRFGTHRMLITEKGAAGRLGSLVTEAELGDNPCITTPEACLLKAGKPCGKCVSACPVSALSETDFTRRACWERLNENRDTLAYFVDLPETTHVCGKCVALMPCSFQNPVKE